MPKKTRSASKRSASATIAPKSASPPPPETKSASPGFTNLPEKLEDILKLSNMTELHKVYDTFTRTPGAQVTEILLNLLASGQKLHVFLAADALKYRGDPSVIARMQEIRKILPPQSGLQDYRSAIDRAVVLLQERQAGRPCNCGMYAMATGFSNLVTPSEEKASGMITIVAEDVHRKSYYTDFYCVCNSCHRIWQVQDEIGYHFPLYKWQEITDSSKYLVYYEKYMNFKKDQQVYRDLDD